LTCIQRCLQFYAAERLANLLCTSLHTACSVTLQKCRMSCRIAACLQLVTQAPKACRCEAIFGASHLSNRMMGCHKTPASFMVDCVQSFLQPCKLCTADATIPRLQIWFSFVKPPILFCLLELRRALHRQHGTFTINVQSTQITKRYKEMIESVSSWPRRDMKITFKSIVLEHSISGKWQSHEIQSTTALSYTNQP
jgi:hypothetical protein